MRSVSSSAKAGALFGLGMAMAGCNATLTTATQSTNGAEPLKVLSPMAAGAPQPKVAAVNRSSPPTSAGPVKSANLKQSVELALLRNPDVGRAMAEIQRSTGDVKVAESAWYPKVGYNSSLGTSTAATPSSVDSSSMRAGLEVNQLVYDFGRADNQILASRAIAGQRNAELRDTQEKVALATSETHLELVRAQKLLVATDKYLTALTNLRTTISLRADSGAANQADVYVAETRVQSARAERIKSNTRYVSSQARLLQLTGTLVKTAPDPAPTMLRVARAVQASPADGGTGVAAAEHATEAARAKLKIAQAALYPSIGLRASYTHPFSNDGTSETSLIGLTVQGDLFTGGANEGRIHAASSDVRSNERSAELARLTNDTEVAVANAEIAGSEQRTLAYARQLENARKARETSLAEYQVGKRTLTEVLNTEQEIFRAETDRINAEGDANLSIVRAASARQVLIQCLAL
jgi:outer membrane protein, adhesin transport system